MKKNRMMRLASGLLVAVLVTTSMISGTYAKYVTTASGSDSARVAKWGVVVTATGSLFGKTYLNATGDTPGEDTAAEATITVKSNNTEKVVAPGTKNDTGITASITGTPEVDVRVVVDVKGLDKDGVTKLNKVEDIFLAKDVNYPDMTTGNAEDTFKLNDVYYPVKFTLTRNGTALVTNGTLAQVEEKLEKLSTTYPTNTNLGTEIGTLNLTWAWAYGTAADTVVNPWDVKVAEADKADTLLGNIMAGIVEDTVVAPANYNLDTGLEISILVEQID